MTTELWLSRWLAVPADGKQWLDDELQKLGTPETIQLRQLSHSQIVAAYNARNLLQTLQLQVDREKEAAGRSDEDDE